MNKHRNVFLYWGRRGGGGRMLQEFVEEFLNKTDERLFISTRTNAPKNAIFLNPRIVNYSVFIPDVLWKSLFLTSFYKSFYDFFKKMTFCEDLESSCNSKTRIIIIMASPLDTLLGPYLSKKFEVWRVIHDGVKHRGDLWPTNRQIKKWIQRDNVIVLSQFVKNQVLESEQNCQFIVSSLKRQKKMRIVPRLLEEEYCLIIGRGKKYQDSYSLEMITDAIPVKVCVAGKSFKSSSKVIRIEKWLTDDELENLIGNAIAVLCLYTSASQSGIIEQSLSFGVPVIASDVGGFAEQIREGVDGFLLKEVNPQNISNAFAKISTLNLHEIGVNRSLETLYETLNRRSF